MGLLKRIFKKDNEEKKPEQECWYNNSAEEKKSRWVETPEGAIVNDAFRDTSLINNAHKHAN